MSVYDSLFLAAHDVTVRAQGTEGAEGGPMRTMFAEDHGIDPFDEEAVDAALKEAGLYDNRKKSIF